MEYKNFGKLFLWSFQSERGIAKNTLSAYEQDLSTLFEFLTKNGTNEKMLQNFYVFLKSEKKSSQATIARRITTAIQFLEFCLEEKLANDGDRNMIALAIADKPKLEVHKTYTSFLSEDDLEKMRNVLEAEKVILNQTTLDENQLITKSEHFESNIKLKMNLRLRLIIEILYSTGLRISELLSLKTIQKDEIFKNSYIKIVGKGGHERVVFFSKVALSTLKEYLAVHDHSYEYLFATLSNKIGFSANKAMTRQRVFQLLKELACKAEIDSEKVFCHSFRHRMLTDLVLAGADLISVQKIAGHKQLNTTAKYTHIEENLYSDIQKFHPFSKQTK